MVHGPYYICVICNRYRYRRSVVSFYINKYNLPQENYFYVAHVASYNGNLRKLISAIDK